MTADVIDQAPPVRYGATLQHIELLNAKIAKLLRAQAQAEEQVFHRASLDYKSGEIDIEELLALYLWIKPRAAEGILFRWNRHMPDEAVAQSIRHTVNRLRRHRPDPDGNWRGTFPFDEGSRYPGHGTSVVYVLFDERNVPCYVGSTGGFKNRMKGHEREGKPFVRYLAHPCSDRDDAYATEDRLLREYKPYLNKRAGR